MPDLILTLNWFTRYDASTEENDMAMQLNQYLTKHELAFEGRYEVKAVSKTNNFNSTRAPLNPLNTNDYYKYRQNDNISHFICRLAYCRNEELRKWFLTQETRLFQIRLSATEIDQ